jgi:hypothetical protein
MTKRCTPAALREAQRAQGTVARRHDQLVGVLGHAGRHRRGQVRHVAAAGHRVGPAGVGQQVGGEDAQPAVVHRQQLAQRRFARQAAHGGVHRPAGGHQLTDEVAGDVAAAAGDCRCRRSSVPPSSRSITHDPRRASDLFERSHA